MPRLHPTGHTTKSRGRHPIAEAQYGDARQDPAIFDANRPMLSHPDEIYPDQVLRIPGLS